MDAETLPLNTASDDASVVRALYQRVLAAWNARDGDAMSLPFAADGVVIGFDGSEVSGQAAIAASMQEIFAHHLTPPYVHKVSSVRLLTAEVVILHAVVGMAPPGQTQINPDLNAVQTLVAVKAAEQWRIALLQTTPAQWHGRPDDVRRLTEELQQLL